jgi:hypothetical protein
VVSPWASAMWMLPVMVAPPSMAPAREDPGATGPAAVARVDLRQRYSRVILRHLGA